MWYSNSVLLHDCCFVLSSKCRKVHVKDKLRDWVWWSWVKTVAVWRFICDAACFSLWICNTSSYVGRCISHRWIVIKRLDGWRCMTVTLAWNHAKLHFDIFKSSRLEGDLSALKIRILPLSQPYCQHSCSARAKRTLFSAKIARTLAHFIMWTHFTFF